MYPVETFLDNEEIDEVLIVSSESNQSVLEKLLTEHQSVSIILGGIPDRKEYCALQYLQDKATDNCLIVIHDAARSFMSSELLTSLVNTAKEHGSAAPYLNNNKFYDIENDEIVANKKCTSRHLKRI